MAKANAWPLPSPPTITPLSLTALAEASLLVSPGTLRSVTLPLTNSTACSLKSVALIEKPTARPLLLTAIARVVELPGSPPSLVILPFCHFAATSLPALSTALPTMRLLLLTAIGLEFVLPSAPPPPGRPGSLVTVLPWTVTPSARLFPSVARPR